MLTIRITGQVLFTLLSVSPQPVDRLTNRDQYVAAIASLKKALYHAPFEWIICYNLGLVHLHTGQFASAFHFFSAAINLKPDFPITYMHLAITLSRLGDFKNACTAYEKAMEMYSDPVVRLNYAILHYSHGDLEQSRKYFAEFDKLFSALDDESRASEPLVLEQRALLAAALFPPEVAASYILPQTPLMQAHPSLAPPADRHKERAGSPSHQRATSAARKEKAKEKTTP